MKYGNMEELMLLSPDVGTTKEREERSRYIERNKRKQQRLRALVQSLEV
jgi:hypothetical protein